MRVLHVIPSISLVRGGPSRIVLDMAHSLQSQGIDIQILTTNDNGDKTLEVPLGKSIIYQGIQTYFFSRYSPPIRALREFAFSFSLTAWLIRNISKYDLLHVHYIFSYPSTIAMFIARLKGIPYLTMPHGSLGKWALEQSSIKKKVYLHLIERANLNNSQFIYLYSEQEQQEIRPLKFRSPTFVLPLATNIPQFIPNASVLLRQHLNLPLDEPIILFLSRLHPKKGLDYLISALSQLLAHRFSFIIAGSGTPEYEAEVDSMLIESGVKDRTHLTGFVDGKAKDLLLQGSSLFALTSHSENFGIVVLEALAVGLPVLLTHGVALSSVVEENSLGYITEMDITEIKQKIEQHLLSSIDNTKGELSSYLRQFTSKNYMWDKVAKDLINIYEECV
jgi:glycosyltransferase involved in cell wall biosynthesis